MAKSTDSTKVEELDDDIQGVDDEGQDETEDDLDEGSDDEVDEQTDDESDESDDEDEPEEGEDFKQRFTQFKGKDTGEYLKNLETGYLESSKEAVTLAKENKAFKETIDRYTKLIASNPDLAKELKAGTEPSADETPTSTDPAVLWAQAEMKRQFQEEYDEFIEAHPEVETDPKLAEELDETLKLVGRIVWEKEKRQVGMGEALTKAWKLLDKDDSDEDVRIAAKNAASRGKSSSGKKGPEGKSKFTEAQISVAMEMMNIDRNEAVKRLSAHSTK